MKRTTLINHIVRKIRANSYLEIGVWNGENFRQISCRHKIGVDPDLESPATFNITSDEFLSTIPKLLILSSSTVFTMPIRWKKISSIPLRY